VSNIIKTKSGFEVPVCTIEQMESMRAWQRDTLTLSESRSIEGAAFSFAMVVRYALGLSADGGTIGALVRDCRAGHVVLATVRHLLNAGAAGAQVVLISDTNLDGSPIPQSPEMIEQLTLVGKLGANVFDYEASSNNEDFEQLLKGCHNLLVGTYSNQPRPSDATLGLLIEVLNELPTPGHCVEMPFGVHSETGVVSSGAMFASSTLSLGLPLSGCIKGSENLGRHYVADCGFALEQYREAGYTGSPLFADQPVVQLIHECN